MWASGRLSNYMVSHALATLFTSYRTRIPLGAALLGEQRIFNHTCALTFSLCLLTSLGLGYHSLNSNSALQLLMQLATVLTPVLCPKL